jgi:hypothetical protein
MKLWIGAETQADIINVFRPIRNEVEAAINATIASDTYDIGVQSWDVVVVLRDDCEFKELTRYSKKNGGMDFRLRLEYSAFLHGSVKQRRDLLFALLVDSLERLSEKTGRRDDTDRLIGAVNNARDAL